MVTESAGKSEITSSQRGEIERSYALGRLHRTIQTYRQNIVAARLLAKIGFRYLADIPRSLPAEEVDNYKVSLRSALATGLEWKELDKGKWIGIDPLPKMDADGTAADIAELAQAYSSSRVDKLLLQHIALEQCVVNSFAQLDALLQDFVDIVADLKPKTLSSGKQLFVEEVLSCSNWESLIGYIKQKFLAEFGRDSLSGRLKVLEKRFGIRANLSDEIMNQIFLAEQVRHIFTHTGGVVSQDFVRLSGRSEYEIGDRISIDIGYCDHLTKALVRLGVELAQSVETTHLQSTRLES